MAPSPCANCRNRHPNMTSHARSGFVHRNTRAQNARGRAAGRGAGALGPSGGAQCKETSGRGGAEPLAGVPERQAAADSCRPKRPRVPRSKGSLQARGSTTTERTPAGPGSKKAVESAWARRAALVSRSTKGGTQAAPRAAAPYARPTTGEVAGPRGRRAAPCQAAPRRSAARPGRKLAQGGLGKGRIQTSDGQSTARSRHGG
jgi:hypothetical protein